jgi:hypothetical protein
VADHKKSASKFLLRYLLTPLLKLYTVKTIMPQNTEITAKNSENQPIAYKQRLNSWAIARLLPDTQREIVARFRSRSDADGYVQHLRQVIPNASFMVVFDCQREEAVV